MKLHIFWEQKTRKINQLIKHSNRIISYSPLNHPYSNLPTSRFSHTLVHTYTNQGTLIHALFALHLSVAISVASELFLIRRACAPLNLAARHPPLSRPGLRSRACGNPGIISFSVFRALRKCLECKSSSSQPRDLSSLRLFPLKARARRNGRRLSGATARWWIPIVAARSVLRDCVELWQ